MYPSRVLLASFVAACSTMACSDDDPVSAGPNPSIPTGTLELGWSIEGSQGAAACEDLSAAAFQVAIIDRGFLVDVIRRPCADFEASFTLYIGEYLVRSTLVDENGYFVVQRVFEDYLPMGEGQVTRMFMDFPSISLPMPPTADAGVTPEAVPPGADAAPLPDASAAL